MELLGSDGNVVKSKDGKFEIKTRVITKPVQMAYINAANNPNGERSDFLVHIGLIDFILTNCIEELKIDGVSFDPLAVAETANIMDEKTLEELRAIHELCAPFLEGLGTEHEKK